MSILQRLSLTFIVLFSTVALAQSSDIAASTTSTPQIVCHSDGKEQHCNGISVGRPKIFDNRSLTLQLEALQKTLKQQQSTNPTIDLKSVMTALANTQGLTQSEVSTVLSVLGNPTPATSLTTDAKTGNVDANGNPSPNTTDTQTSKTVASATAAAPSFDSFASLPAGFNPTFGPSASDLLNDQVNLSYQIVNLQMILERALSDRLYSHCETFSSSNKDPNCTRLQTVLGFNVTIDPPRVANDAVAVVEVVLRNSGSGTSIEDQPSLVAVMPQEKTYNSAALSSKSNAYSGAVVANAFQVSGGYRKRNQTFYVYRDTDTLAYERMTKDGELVFGWMFRPVLGRRAVSPGLRQLFAVISLPQRDCDHKEIGDVSEDKKTPGNCDITLKPTVHTYWKKYDRATQTSFERHDANRAKQFWYILSATLAKPQIFKNDSYLNTAKYGDLIVRSSASYEEALRPVVQKVVWNPTGEKSIIISVTGRNFFTNTQVKLGDTLYSEENKNLVIKSDQSFDIITTVDQLTAGPGSILGRYGLSIPIVQEDPPLVSNTIKDGFQIEAPIIGPVIDGFRTLDISLVKRAGPSDRYAIDQAELARLQAELAGLNRTLDDLHTTYQNKVSALKSKQADLAKLKASPKQAASKTVQLQSEVDTVSKDADSAEKAWGMAKKEFQDKSAAFDDKKNKFYSRYELQLNESSDSTSKKPSADNQPVGSNLHLQTPIISVNSTALAMPYLIYDANEDKRHFIPAHVAIHAAFPDSLFTDGVGKIKISWPFYDSDIWTRTLLYTNPDGQFKVDRVSANSVVIRRDQPSGFEEVSGKPCWTFIASDTPVQLATSNCTPDPVKGKPAPIIQKALNVASVTIGDKETFPGQAVLLGPDNTVYHLTIPDFPDKKASTSTTPKPIDLKQNDAAWIKITLPKGKSAKTVEANGATLQWRPVKAEKPDSKAPATIEVEITRTLTAKSGSIEVSVLDASSASVASQTVVIACNECTDKKGDQK